jgi:dTDP-D-glucose 4,6-dehydratase
MTILVTGGCGFIGSNFIRYILTKYPSYKIINLDALTYAGNKDNLKDANSTANISSYKVMLLFDIYIKHLIVCFKKMIFGGIYEDYLNYKRRIT